MASIEDDYPNWWYSEAQGALFNGPGFDFDNIISIDGNNLVIQNKLMLESPILIPIDRLMDFIKRSNLKSFK